MAGKYNTTFYPLTITNSDGRAVPDAPDESALAPADIQKEMDLKWRIAIGELLKFELAPANDSQSQLSSRYL
jgi:hypothetical protein